MKNQNDYKLALSTADEAPATAPILLVGNIDENLKAASQLGYQGIEIHMRENAELDFTAINEACKKYNVLIASVVTGRLHTQENVSLTDRAKANRSKVTKGLKTYINVAAKFNSDIIIGWIRGKIGGLDRDEYKTRLGTQLHELNECAEEKNVRIHIEGINRYEIDTLNKAQDILDLINDYKLGNTYVHLDTFHMNIEEVDIAKTIKMCGKKLGYIHFADSNRRYPGAGHINFISIIKALRDIGYKNYISVECLPCPDRMSAAKKALENIQNLFMEDNY